MSDSESFERGLAINVRITVAYATLAQKGHHDLLERLRSDDVMRVLFEHLVLEDRTSLQAAELALLICGEPPDTVT